MLIRCKYLFIVLFAIQICIGCSYAGQDAGGPCTTSADCNPGLWCEEFTGGPTTFKQCSECQNHPASISSCEKTTVTDPGTCYYTDHGGTDQNSCPWKTICPNKSNFDHGIWTPKAPSVIYSGTGDQPDCEYDPENITCYAGYYRYDEACEQCNNKPTGASYLNGDEYNGMTTNECPWEITCVLRRQVSK